MPQTLDVALNDVSPLGVMVKLERVCKDCPITLDGKNFPTDLMVLSIKEFNVILGINWITKYHTNLDYVSNSITFLAPRSLTLNF